VPRNDPDASEGSGMLRTCDGSTGPGTEPLPDPELESEPELVLLPVPELVEPWGLGRP